VSRWVARSAGRLVLNCIHTQIKIVFTHERIYMHQKIHMHTKQNLHTTPNCTQIHTHQKKTLKSRLHTYTHTQKKTHKTNFARTQIKSTHKSNCTHLTNYTGRHTTTLHTHTKHTHDTPNELYTHTKQITHTHETNYTRTHTHETNYTRTYTHQTQLRAHTNQKHT